MPITALAIVSTGAHHQKTRVFLDSGSHISLITRRLANSLQAPGVKVPYNISGLPESNSFVSEHGVCLTLTNAGEVPGDM